MNARRCLLTMLAICVCASIVQLGATVEAAGLTLGVRSTDATQFPKVAATIGVVDNLDVPIDLVGRGLDRSAVTLVEDSAPVTDFQIQPTFDPQQAYAIAILVDTASTMNDAGKLAATKTALDSFIDEMGQQDSVALLSFSDQVKVLQGYTSDKDALKQAVGQLSANGPAAMYDAINQAAQFQAAISQKRKVLLVVTDGGDTASKQNQAGATSAARNANVPIYAIGIGPDVHHDILDQISGNTTGQVIYVAGASDLPPAFQSFADRLRRLWIISYTSKLPGDDRTHTLSITVKEQNQTQTGQGTFSARSNALAFQVSGLVNATRVTGITPVTVNVTTGTASSMQLLVDDQSRQSIASAPYVFQWDTTKETIGIHRVVIRATGANGPPTDQEFVVEVLAPASAATPTASPIASTGSTAPIATPVPPAQPTSPPLYLLGVLAAVVVVGAIVAGIILMRRRKPVAKRPPVTVVPRMMDDRTEQMLRPNGGETQAIGETVDLRPLPSRQPRARVHLVQQGLEKDIVLSQAETILGRDPSNPILVQDPMASRKHARIVLENGEYWIEDLKSLNGLKVNGEVATRHKLANGDQVKIGEAVLTFLPDGK